MPNERRFDLSPCFPVVILNHLRTNIPKQSRHIFAAFSLYLVTFFTTFNIAVCFHIVHWLLAPINNKNWPVYNQL